MIDWEKVHKDYEEKKKIERIGLKEFVKKLYREKIEGQFVLDAIDAEIILDLFEEVEKNDTKANGN